MRDKYEKLSPVTIILHWSVGIGIMGLVGMGIYMTENQLYELYPVHKSLGLLLVMIALTRFIWRLINKFPTPAGQYTKIEHVLAKSVHCLLLICTLVIPLSGITMSIASGYGVSFFQMELISANLSTTNPTEIVATNHILASTAAAVHSIASYFLMILLALHILGALKHHMFDKDNTLKRMLGISSNSVNRP